MLKFRLGRLGRALCLLAVCLLVLPLTAQTHQPAGPSVQVNTVQAFGQPQLAWRCDADITMVVWSGDSQGTDPDASIQGRFFSGLTPTGLPFQVNQTTGDTQELPKVRTLDNGDFAVAWRTRVGTNGPYSFHLRTYDRVTLAPRPEQEFGMAIDDNGAHFDYDISEDGRVALAWVDNLFVRAQVYDLEGQSLGPELSLEIEPEAPGNPLSISNPAIHLSTGVTALRWRTYETLSFDQDQSLIQFQKFQSDGSLLGPTVTAAGVTIDFGFGASMIDPRSHLTRNGELLFSYVRAWFPFEKDERFSLYARRYDDDGTPSSFVTVYETYSFVLGNHDLKPEDDGDFLVVWDTDLGPVANRVGVDEPDAGPMFNPVDTDGSPRSLNIDFNGPGSAFAVTWVDDGIHLRRFLSYPNMLLDGFESGDTSRWCVARGIE